MRRFRKNQLAIKVSLFRSEAVQGVTSMRPILPVVSSVLAAAIVCGACSGPAEPPEVSSEIEAGKRAFVAFDFHTARDVFGAVLEERPEDPEAAYGYARTLMILNQFEEAVIRN